jgi:segregation and condensation protein B
VSTNPIQDDDRGDEAAVIEAVLFAGGPAVDAARIAEVIGAEDEGPVIEVVARLNQNYFRQGRPYEIRRSRAGLQMSLRPEFAPIVRRLRGHSREVRLSVAAIEVLSIIAYRQPIDLQTIDSVRGVDSAAIVRQLRRRNLIEPAECSAGGTRTGHYRTTKRFLELFRLSSLEDLPRVQDLEKA